MRVQSDAITVRDAINSHLPDDIRILGIVKVIRNFDARRQCDKRKYEYLLPLWVLDPNVGKEMLLYPTYAFGVEDDATQPMHGTNNPTQTQYRRRVRSDRFLEPLWRHTVLPTLGLPTSYPTTEQLTTNAHNAAATNNTAVGGAGEGGAVGGGDGEEGDEGASDVDEEGNGGGPGVEEEEGKIAKRTYRRMGVWACVCMGVYLYECMGVYVYGCMVVWDYEYGRGTYMVPRVC